MSYTYNTNYSYVKPMPDKLDLIKTILPDAHPAIVGYLMTSEGDSWTGSDYDKTKLADKCVNIRHPVNKNLNNSLDEIFAKFDDLDFEFNYCQEYLSELLKTATTAVDAGTKENDEKAGDFLDAEGALRFSAELIENALKPMSA